MTSAVDFQLEKSNVDYRKYRYIQLENGLKAVLISSIKPGEKLENDTNSESETDGEEVEDLEDEDSKDDDSLDDPQIKSAAALCIKTGSFSDPPEAQGLSHFLEHMVFMGSAKYPNENDFDSYLSRRGGRNNAWTGNEHTLFHFDVKRKHFPSCLDRFAQFFIAPLLLQDSTDREVAAVHSEYELANAKDSSRLQYLVGCLCLPNSPYCIFSYGNTKSLIEIPQKNGTPIYSMLDNYRRNNYSAHRMTLAIQSKHSLDELELLVRKTFDSIPTSHVPAPDFKSLKTYENRSCGKLYRVYPVGVKERLRIIWILPSQLLNYESMPVDVIASLVGHEGEGSILALLKAENLAVSLGAGYSPTTDYDNSSLCCIFAVHIHLTDNGRDNIFKVCQIVFDYIKVLLNTAMGLSSSSTKSQRECHNFSSYLMEFKAIKEASFYYCEPDEPEDTVVDIANMLQLVNPEHVFSGYKLLKKPNLQLCIDLLKLLTPEQASVFFLSSSFSTQIKDESKLEIEPWFNITYQTEDIPTSIMQEWKTSIPSEKLHMPYINKFLTTDFTLLDPSEDMKYPIDLNLRPESKSRLEYGHLWFQQSTRFKSPKAYVMVHLWSDRVAKSSDNLTLHTVMVYGLNQTLSTIAYEASEADLTYDLAFRDSGVRICVGGFSEKLFTFYSTIIDHIVSESKDLSKEHFESHRDAVRQSYYNEALKPNILNSCLQYFLLRKDAYLFSDVLNTLRTLTVADSVAYKQRFFSTLHLTIYVHGNLRQSDAIKFFDYTVQKIHPTPLRSRKFTDTSILDPGSYHLRVMNCNPNDVNMCVARVHLLGECDIVRQSYNKLLAYILSEPAFDFLRTKETLGYTVFLRYWRSTPGGSLHSGISVIVCSQANQFSIEHVTGRMNAFWCYLAPLIIAAISDKTYKTMVDSLISIHQLEDTNMLTEVERNWEEIMEGTYNFQQREDCIKILKTITKEKLFDFFLTEYLDNRKQTSLLVQIDATPTPDPNASQLSQYYMLDFTIVKPNDQNILKEKQSCCDVDVKLALENCGYHIEEAKLFLNNYQSSNSDKFNLSCLSNLSLLLSTTSSNLITTNNHLVNSTNDHNNNNNTHHHNQDNVDHEINEENVKYIENLHKFRSHLQFAPGRQV